jgi:hypothetical protein
VQIGHISGENLRVCERRAWSSSEHTVTFGSERQGGEAMGFANVLIAKEITLNVRDMVDHGGLR